MYRIINNFAIDISYGQRFVNIISLLISNLKFLASCLLLKIFGKLTEIIILDFPIETNIGNQMKLKDFTGE